MSRSATVSIDFVESLLLHAEQQGYNLDSLLSSVGMTRSELEGRSDFPADQFNLLYQHVMWLVQDESFGLLTGGNLPTGTFRMMCFAMITCTNLGDAVRRCSQFYEICKGPRVKPEIVVDGDKAYFHYVALNSMPADTVRRVVSNETPAVIRSSISIWHHFMSWMIGYRLPLLRASFTFAEQPNLSDYQNLFQCPIDFNASENRLTFPADQLSMPMMQNAETLRSFLRTAPYQLMVMVNGDRSVSAQVKGLIGRDFSRSPPSIQEVASALNMSARTLRRHLDKEGTTYQALKDQSRFDAAQEYLSYPNVSVQEVAALLGFTEPSAFVRAFRKWSGVTPAAYRDAQQEAIEQGA
ncbi:transcriptional regulator [Marinobacterium nitratireducens]|uniref:Transcriptional regulator n=1 Tax=Marinobacterium nitratireducens TaxID=518897 RepID=A0A917Z7S8_9GAMM|nr:AraC family transcriptional regulator [Marinobacterium nitratireducens]GGO76823.1 transcriptional regulator [Marinobacterium nitratireducens]